MNSNFAVKCDKNHRTMFMATIIDAILVINDFIFCQRSLKTLFKFIARYGGNSKIKDCCLLLSEVFSKIYDKSTAITTPRTYRPRITKILFAPKKAPPSTV